MTPQPLIDVLLASYNGEKYIAEQLHSLLNQTHKNIRILIRDDFSTDSTPTIIKSFSEIYPEKIKIIPSSKRVGVRDNYSLLLSFATADYICFCDQDDVWDKNKIFLSLDRMKKEEQFAPHLPLLICTDLKVVNHDLKIIHDSFWDYSGLQPTKLNCFNRLLVNNFVTGCTMMINKPLKLLIDEIPPQAIIHDWWIAIVANALGKIIPLDYKTISYRQHNNNSIGANPDSIGYLSKRLRYYISHPKAVSIESDILISQGLAFYKKYGQLLDPSKKKSLEIFLKGSSLNWFQRKFYFLKYGFFRRGVLRNLLRFATNRPF